MTSYRYRVMRRDKEEFAYHRSNDLRETLDAFIALLKGHHPLVLNYDRHAIGGEPVIEARKPEGQLIAVLYGVTWEQWEDNVQAG
jgi:hypothetical protein